MLNQYDKINKLSDLEFIEIVSSFYTKKDLLKYLNLSSNGTAYKFINTKIKQTNAKLKPKQLKYDLLTKTCPVCNTIFITKNDSKEKQTCSYACSNTYFRSGTNNGAHIKAISNNSINSKIYRTICFSKHIKECCICKENRIVEVHHFDNDHNNNDIYNLIPLCPTHHKLYHSKYKLDVEQYIINYYNDFKKNNGSLDEDRTRNFNRERIVT